MIIGIQRGNDMKQKIGLVIYVLLAGLGLVIIIGDSIEATPDIADVLSGAALYLIGRDIWKNSN